MISAYTLALRLACDQATLALHDKKVSFSIYRAFLTIGSWLCALLYNLPKMSFSGYLIALLASPIGSYRGNILSSHQSDRWSFLWAFRPCLPRRQRSHLSSDRRQLSQPRHIEGTCKLSGWCNAAPYSPNSNRLDSRSRARHAHVASFAFCLNKLLSSAFHAHGLSCQHLSEKHCRNQGMLHRF